jgi:HEAT repeat protein
MRALHGLGLEGVPTRELLKTLESTMLDRHHGRHRGLAHELARRGGSEVEGFVARALGKGKPLNRMNHLAWLAGRLRVEGAVPGLIKAVPDARDGRVHHPQVAHEAIEALGAIGTPAADRALTRFITAMTASPLSRLCYVCQERVILGMQHSPSAERVTAVLELIRDPRFRLVDWAVAFRLVLIADERFAPFFVEMLAGPEPRVGLAGLERVATWPAEGALVGVLGRDPDRRSGHQATRALLRFHKPSGSIPALLSHYQRHPAERRAAAWLLGRVGPRYSWTYTNLLKDPDPRVRAEAATSFGLIAEPKVLPSLLPLLSDPVHYVRARTATALGAFADEKSAGRLREAAESDAVRCVRDAAAAALRRRAAEPVTAA